MNGIDSNEMNEKSLSRSILIQPFKREEGKLLHLEFQSNPLNTLSDYRIKGLSQSLLINYHAVRILFFIEFFFYFSVKMTINKLIECFLPSREHDLQG